MKAGCEDAYVGIQLGHLLTAPQEQTVTQLHDVGLMDGRDLAKINQYCGAEAGGRNYFEDPETEPK